MTFIDQPKSDSNDHKKTKPKETDDSASQHKEEAGNQVETIGLTGGQSKDSNGGVDISQYTGPESKSSSLFIDPKAEFKTGPGNGLSSEGNQEETERIEPPEAEK